MFLPGLPIMGIQIRCPQKWYATVQVDLKHCPAGSDPGECYYYSTVNNSWYLIKAKIFAYWFMFIVSVFGVPMVARRVRRIKICPSVLLSVPLSGSFLGICLLFSPEIQHVSGPVWCYVTAGFFEKSFFCPPKIIKWAKRGFFSIFSVWSVMKVHIICCIPTHPIFGKNLVHEMWVKMLLANQIAGFLPLEQNDKIALFFACWWELREIIGWLKNVGGGCVQKMDVATLYRNKKVIK